MDNATYQFRTSFFQQFKLLMPMFGIYIIVIAASFFLHFSLLSIGFKIVFAFLFLVDTLPTLIIYCQYLLRNKGASLIINTTERRFEYISVREDYKYCFDDIQSLDYYRSYGKGSGMHSFGQFRYYKILMKDNAEIVVTCVLVHDIEDTIERLLRITAAKHFRLVCFL